MAEITYNADDPNLLQLRLHPPTTGRPARGTQHPNPICGRGPHIPQT